MKGVIGAYATKRKCSVQEAVCLVMQDLWLYKIFSKVVMLNGNLPKNNIRYLNKKM